jgi:hypothetical protein
MGFPGRILRARKTPDLVMLMFVTVVACEIKKAYQIKYL